MLFSKSLVDSAVLLNHAVSFPIFGSYILFYKQFMSLSVFQLKIGCVDIVCYLFYQAKYIRHFITAAIVVRLLIADIPLAFDSFLPEAWEMDVVMLAFVLLKPLFSPTRLKDLLDAFLYYKLDNQTFYYGAAYERSSLKV